MTLFLSVFCPVESLTDPNYWNRVGLFRIGSNQNILDTLLYELPNTILGFAVKNILLHDNNNDLILISETHRNHLYDSILGQNISASPIFIQKICYNCVDDLQGKVFFDTQNDCLYDSTETIVENNIVHLMPEDIYTKTDKEGRYSFSKSSGIATVEYISKFDNAYLCNVNNSYTVNMANGINDSLHFGLKVKVPNLDLACNMVSGLARPGFQQFTIIDVENFSIQKVIHSTCLLTLDSLFAFVGSTPMPDSISGNTLYWHIDSMNPGEIKEFIVLNQVQAPLNYLYQHNVYVQTVGDNYLPNNTDTTNGIVIGSYDPNYKAANPVGIGPQHFIENNIPIHYYVEFQNTGTDTAFNIKIFDELDDHFDINTLVVKKSSHPMHYKVVNRQLQFYFENILLVDSNKDYDKSIGFLTYSIMPKKCMDGTVIKNNAAIYFDFNEPITTNTTYHTIGRPGCLFDNENLNDFNFFPNPVNEQMMMITVNMTTDEPYSIILTDLTGKTINQLSSSKEQKGKYQHPMYFSNKIQAGIYFLTLKTSHNNITKKVIFGH